jgi:hypothetical protein
MHRLPRLFPFSHATDVDDVRERLAEIDAALSGLRVELHRRMKWRARYRLPRRVLDNDRRYIERQEAMARAGREALRRLEAQAYQPQTWKVAA